MKKVMSLILAASMLFLMTISSFADQTVDGRKVLADYYAELAEKNMNINAIGIKEKFGRISNEYQCNSGGMKIIAPLNGNEGLSIKNEGIDPIKMQFPKEFLNAEGVIAKNGSVVYSSDKESMEMSVRVVTQAQDGLEAGMFENTIMLKKVDVPTEFSYTYDLPDGYNMINDYDYNEDAETADEIFVVNADNEIVDVITPTVAVDIDGNPIETKWVLEDLELKAQVNLDGDENYPVVLSVANHPNKTKTGFLTKSQVLSVRNKFRTSSSKSAFSYAIGLLLGKTGHPIIGAAWATLDFLGTQYNSKQFSTWDKIYVKFKKKYAKVSMPYKWHSGKRCYYPTGRLKVAYVDKK